MSVFLPSRIVMKRLLTTLMLASMLPAQAFSDCREIVASTLAEMRAGASEWNADMERIARSAAGSACVKAGGDASSMQLRETAISEAAQQDGGAGATTGAAASEAAAAGEGEEAWHPMKGFKFNKVTGSPGKKPYERRREVNETEAERELEEE